LTTAMSQVGTKWNLNRKLEKDFYFSSASQVAPRLLGKVIVKKEGNFILAARIVEVEAYLGKKDKASHAFGGRRTSRTQIMYEEGGRVYIYKIYGLCWCFNIVTSVKDDPQTVFVRAVEPLAGIDLMRQRRKNKNPSFLTNGPCRWTESFGLDKTFLGRKLYADKELFVVEDKSFASFVIKRDKRIGIDYAAEDKNRLWRFYIKGSPWVSVQ